MSIDRYYKQPNGLYCCMLPGYGIMFYIVGRTNLLEKFVLKLNKMLEDATKNDDDMRKEDERK